MSAPYSQTNAFRLTPTGNPLTEEQIAEWRKFLQSDDRSGGWPVGCNVLCDMALAALRAQSAGPEETVAALLRDLRHEIGENMGYAASATILERIDAALKNAAPQGVTETTVEASIAKPAESASTPEAGADVVKELGYLYWSAYHAGHHDTVEASYTDVLQIDRFDYWRDRVEECVNGGDMPTMAKLSATPDLGGKNGN